MDTVVRATTIYFFLLVFLRLSGKRTMQQITTFDFVLLLVIGESTQQGLIGDDFSLTTAMLLITSLIGIDIGISLLKDRFKGFEKLVEGTPLVLVEHGEPIDHAMRKSRVDANDIMQAAREMQGLERMEQIKYAVLERSGSISIVPAS